MEDDNLLLQYAESFLTQEDRFCSSAEIAAHLGLSDRIDYVIRNNLHKFRQINDKNIIRYQVIEPVKEIVLPMHFFEQYGCIPRIPESFSKIANAILEN